MSTRNKKHGTNKVDKAPQAISTTMCYYFIPYSIAQLLFRKLISHSPTRPNPKSPIQRLNPK